MKIVATAPCRVDLAGGTMDIWPLYLYHHRPVTVNFAVNLFTRCEVETLPDKRILLCSGDLERREEFASLEKLEHSRRYRLPLLAWVVRHFAPHSGVSVKSFSEAPAGAGISGSSALLIALSGAFNRLTRSGYSIERIREVAQNIEAQIIRVPTGAQDYYPAMYGGVNALELGVEGIRRKVIPVDPEELNRRFVLAYTGLPRNSGINNWEVMKAHIDGQKKVFANFNRIAEIARGMRTALEQKDWEAAGRLLRKEWSNRRKNAPGISTPLIDRLVERALKLGALGAKVCGAGGGGCVVFLTRPERKQAVQEALREEGAVVLDAAVARRGLRVQVSVK